jgi:predicted CoA-substrate-specific enzyme activase
MFSIGIDIGYSTLKCVVISDEKIQVYNSNIFHHGNVDKLLKELLEKLQNQFKIENCYIGITGQKEKFLKEYQVNDISALVEGTIFTNKEIKSIIEIGAQSSRLITGISNKSRVGIKFFSNTSCSAGTGSFLEEQVSRLGIRLDEYSDYIKDAKKVIRIAGRCSVFSKTDMIHHQQAGEKTEDILLGLSYALARNYKANVVQRNNIQKPVMFVGGVAKNVGVVRAIKEIFNFSEEDFIIPSDCSSIGALGVAILVRNKKDIVNIQNVIDNIGSKSKVITYSLYNPLKDYGENDSAGKHNCKNIDAVLVDGYIGIDIGSTSTNVVLINGDREIIAYRYIRTKGNPKKAVDDAMKSIKAEFKGRLNIKSIGTTGSGRNLVGNLLGADVVVNEITAQSKGATEMDAEVDTIFEIGGQDSKYISVKNCRVVDFEMNKICAAGTGSFIEEQSKKLAIPIEEYADIALKGNNPLDLGNRCTVFIEGNISKAIADGESKENIIAGLSYSIVNNYLNRVVGKKPIGKKIFLQGGIAYNQAVVNAFRSVTGKEIIVPPFFSVTGAFGVALLANENVENENEKENKLIASKYRNVQSEIDALFLKGYTGNIEKDKLTVGIPRVLFLHKLFPLFNVFFKELGFNVILSDETDSNIVEMSQEYSLDETCYPIKLINGHVASLLKRNVDYIFLPSLYTMKHPISKTREDYACVYMQKAPQIVSKVMDLQERGIKLLSPALSFKFGKKYMMNTLMKLGSDLEKSKLQTTLALAKGMKRFKQFEDDVEELGKDVISKLEDDEKVFVIITRAYGVADKGLNMGIPEKLRKMGYKVLTLSNLPAHSLDISEDYPNMFWPFGQHILSGARIVKKSKNLYAIYLTNHGCGPDTILKKRWEISLIFILK